MGDKVGVGMSLEHFMDNAMKRRKSGKKNVSKNAHKHGYKLIRKEEVPIVDGLKYIKVCPVCGKVKEEIMVGENKLFLIK